VQKLHLVGFTTDQDGLILSARRGARSGGYTLVLDDALATAVEELRARQDEADEPGARGDRAESRLPVSEIQARLRRGRSLKDVAKDAGMELDWVERFAAPVFAEQAQVISRVRNTPLRRPRLGPSGLRIGDAVRRNLVERGVVMSPDEFNAAWTTHQRADGRWIVRFSFHYRGSNKTLRFDVVEPNGEPVAADALTNQLAYVTPPPKRPTPKPKPVKGDAEGEPPTAKRAVVSVGFRPDPPAKAVSRPAKERERAAKEMNKAAARRAIEGERAAAKKARERSRLLAQREREARVEEQRRQREQAARVREAAVAARIAAVEQAERDAAAAKAAAARQAERQAEREAARRAARLKVKARGTASPSKSSTAKSSAGSSKSTSARKTAPAKAATTQKASAQKAAAQRAAARTTPARTTPARTNPAVGTSPTRAPVAKAGEPVKAARSSAPPRPDARVHAAPPPSATRRRDEPTAPVPRVEARDAERRAPAARAPEPQPQRRTRRDVEADARAEPRPGLSGAAVDVYGPEATRALFRAGLVEQARAGSTSGGSSRAVPKAAEPDSTENGSVAAPRKRPPGARRTRPLRAN
jgi:hypothetical protein